MTRDAQAWEGFNVDVIIGVSPDAAGRDAIALGLAACRTIGARPVFVRVYPSEFDFPGAANVDAEWHKFVSDQGNEILEWARAEVAGQPDMEGLPEPIFVLWGHRSSGVGLEQVADQHDTALIAIGSAPGGRTDHLHSGSTADRLFHGARVPVIMAPHGYRVWAPTRIGRLVVAYQEKHASGGTIDTAINYARIGGLKLLLLTLIERTTSVFGSTVGTTYEDEVIATAAGAAVERLNAVQAAVPADIPCETEVAVGSTISRALDRVIWQDDDVILAGSAAGLLKRVFIGDITNKILRSASVPVAVTPHKD